jgi:hypothetical protein
LWWWWFIGDIFNLSSLLSNLLVPVVRTMQRHCVSLDILLNILKNFYSLQSNLTDDTGSSSSVTIRGTFIIAHGFQDFKCLVSISFVKDQSPPNHLLVRSYKCFGGF